MLEPFSFISWNTRRASKSRLKRGVKKLTYYSKGPVLLQESRHGSILPIRGFCNYGDGFGLTGVLWPTRWGEQLSDHLTDQGVTGVILKTHKLFLASVYLPDSWKSIELFLQAVERLRAMILYAQRKGALAMILAGDFNVSFGSEFRGASTGILGPRLYEPGRESCRERELSLFDLCLEFNLCLILHPGR